ncbi:MAG: cation transporter [Candidatus Nanopelagicales bacterium]
MNTQRALLQVGGTRWAARPAAVREALYSRPGVLGVRTNPVNQTALVSFDPDRTTFTQLSAWVRECRRHCAGQTEPAHECAPTS